MSDLSSIVPGGPGPIGPLNRVNAPVAPHASVMPAAAGRADYSAGTGDRVELSSVARYMDMLRRLPDARLEKVQAARQAIAEGLYDSDSVLDQTIERLGEDL